MVDKVTWQKVGRVTEPGRYMFRFGWLTVTDADLAIWRQYPDAQFTLVMLPSVQGSPSAVDSEDEFHLGAFDLPEHPAPGEP
ncbi:MAG TPA: hypothetical protein VGC36_05495 [Rhizomicrobium sp.]